MTMRKKDTTDVLSQGRPDIERIKQLRGRKLELSAAEVIDSLVAYIEQLEAIVRAGGDPDGD